MSTNTEDSKAKVGIKPFDEQHHCIEVAAYYIAESRGFDHGCDLENWLAAEARVDQLGTEGKLQPQLEIR